MVEYRMSTVFDLAFYYSVQIRAYWLKLIKILQWHNTYCRMQGIIIVREILKIFAEHTVN